LQTAGPTSLNHSARFNQAISRPVSARFANLAPDGIFTAFHFKISNFTVDYGLVKRTNITYKTFVQKRAFGQTCEHLKIVIFSAYIFGLNTMHTT